MMESFAFRQEGSRTLATVRGLPPGERRITRPSIIPVFIPMSGCRHRCTFCDQAVITGRAVRAPSKDIVTQAVNDFLPFVQHRPGPIQIAFYGGNFLGLPERTIRELLEAAAAFVSRGRAAGIRFSTRPDTITATSLAALRDYPVSTVEIGLQSLDDRVLFLAHRGHDAACTMTAAHRVKDAGFALGLQMMTGLPGDTFQGALLTAERMLTLAPDAVRIYPTLVFASSALADQFRSGAFVPGGLAETIDLVSRLFLLFTAAGIPVIRMGLQNDEMLSAPGNLLGGPFHPCLGEAVYSHVFYALAAEALDRHPARRPSITIRVHPRHLSRMVGVGGRNRHRLRARCGHQAVAIIGDAAVGPHHVEIENLPKVVASDPIPS